MIKVKEKYFKKKYRPAGILLQILTLLSNLNLNYN
jgi:hypothetical protein